MIWQDFALIGAGIIGSSFALIHGTLVRRRIARPLDRLMLESAGMSDIAKPMVPVLLDFSGFNWFLSGLALIAAAIWLGPEARGMAAFLACSSFLFAALGNLSCTRGRHFGWIPYSIAVVLIIGGILG